MLDTNLKHIETVEEWQEFITKNENAMICCGRMGPMCLPVYDIMEDLEEEYTHVKFSDMDFDIPAARVIRTAPEVRGFMGLPFTMYYKNGKVVRATTSIQDEDQLREILDAEFAK